MKSRKIGNNGKSTDDYIQVARFDVILFVVVELAHVGHEERMNEEGV